MSEILTLRVNDQMKDKFKEVQEKSGKSQAEFFDIVVENFLSTNGSREIITTEEKEIARALTLIQNNVTTLLGRLDDTYKEGNANVVKYNADVSEGNQIIEALNKENAVLIQDKSQLAGVVDELKSKHEEEIAILGRQIAELTSKQQKEIEQIKTSAAKELDVTTIKMQKEIDKLEAIADTVASWKKQATEARSKLEKAELLTKDNTELETKLTISATELTQLKSKFNSVESDLDKIKSKLDEEKTARITAQASANGLTPYIEHLKNEIIALNDKLNTEKTLKEKASVEKQEN